MRCIEKRRRARHSYTSRFTTARDQQKSIAVRCVDLIAADEKRFPIHAVKSFLRGVEYVRVMLGHQDEIEIVRIRGCDQLVERTRAVTAEVGVCVDDAFVFFEVWIGVARPLRIELRDLLRKLTRFVSAIDKRYLRQHEHDEQEDQNSLDDFLHHFFSCCLVWLVWVVVRS